MPNEVSDTFHDIEHAIEAFFEKEWEKVQSGLATILDDAKTVVAWAIDEASPILIAAANAAVQAALATQSGGLSAIVAAAEAAGLAILKQKGEELGEEALVKFGTLVRANVLKASAPAGDADQTTTGG